jgi:hypothetical protein
MDTHMDSNTDAEREKDNDRAMETRTNTDRDTDTERENGNKRFTDPHTDTDMDSFNGQLTKNKNVESAKLNKFRKIAFKRRGNIILKINVLSFS